MRIGNVLIQVQVVLLLAFGAALCLGGCGGEGQAQPPQVSVIRLHGSTTVGPALEPLADAYLLNHPGVRFERPSKYDPDPVNWWRGSEVGVAKVTLGVVEIGGCSRNLALDELEAARTKGKQLEKLFTELEQSPAHTSSEALKKLLGVAERKSKAGLDSHKIAAELKTEFEAEPFLGWIAKELYNWVDKSRDMSDDARREEIRKQRGLKDRFDGFKMFIGKLAKLASDEAFKQQLRIQELRVQYVKNKLLQVALWDLDDAFDRGGLEAYSRLLGFLKEKAPTPVTLKAYQVGYDALVPIVNKGKRGALKGVTQQQMIDIYFTGKLRYWDELLDYSQDPTGKKVFDDHTLIKARSRDPYKSGTGNAFIEVVNKALYEKKRAASYASYVEYGEPVQLNQWAADDGDVFAYNGFGNLPKRDEPAFSQVNLLMYAGAKNEKKPEEPGSLGFVAPNMANFSSGLYKCQRPLFVITNGTPRGEVNRFMQFILDREGQKIIEQADFVPVMGE